MTDSTKRNILILDDDASIIRLVSTILSRHDFHTTPAETIADARELLAGGCFDLLLCDIDLPDGSGLDLIASLAESMPALAVVMMTVIGDIEIAKRAIALGVDGYITKPFDKSQILIGVENGIRGRELKMKERAHKGLLELMVQEKTAELQRTIFELEGAHNALSHSERKVRDQLAFLDTMMNAIPSPVFYKDTLGKYQGCNKSYENFCGFPQTELVGKTAHDIVPKHLADIYEAADRRLLESPGEQHYAAAVNFADGNHHDVIFHKATYRNADGELGGIVGVIHDVTEAKKAERDLTRAVTELSAIHAHVPIAMLLVDRDRRVQKVNAFAALFAEKNSEEMIGLRGGEAMCCLHRGDHPSGCGFGPSCDDCGIRLAVLDTFADQQSRKNVEAWLSVKRGEALEQRFLMVSTAFLELDGQERVLVCLQDMTEKKRAEEALQESEGRHRSLFEQASDGIFLFDDNETIFEANSKILEILGYQKREVIGTNIFDLVHPEDLRRTPSQMHRLLNGEAVLIERRLRRKDGRYITFESNFNRIKENAILGVYRDISERKRMEERLIRQHDALKEAHEELKRVQLQNLQQEKMASIGQLAAGVAHEINNPTGFVSSNLRTLKEYSDDLFDLIRCYKRLVDLLQTEKAGVQEGAAHDLIEEIQNTEADIDLEYLMEDTSALISESQEGTDRIKKIVIDLKDFAHPGQHERMSADINKNLDSVLNIVWNELKYKATVEKAYGDIPEIYCYPQQLNQVFMNLLVNAAQSIESQGCIRIETGKVGTDRVAVRISDTGCGIPAENLSRIFDPFYTTKPVGKGTGLGLNVAYNLVKKHGGEIRVESEVSSGTEFIIHLPVDGSEETARV